MAMKIQFHETARIDRLIKIWGGVAAALAATFVCFTYINAIADPYWVTEEEVISIDKYSMLEHEKEIEKVPYAMKDDINHIINSMVNEKIKDAQNEILELEDKEDTKGELSAAERRKIQRLENDIADYEKELVEDIH